jgi:heat shock protein HslJ
VNSLPISETIFDTNWELSSWKSGDESHLIDTMIPITLFFDKEKNQLSGSDGCNNFFAGFKLKDAILNIGPTGGTKKYCGDESSAIEKDFHLFLEKELTANMNEKKLQLTSDTELLIFKAKN